MTGIERSQIVTSPLDLVNQRRRDLDTSLLKIVDVMSSDPARLTETLPTTGTISWS